MCRRRSQHSRPGHPQVQALCLANSDGSKRVALDTGSGGSFDVSYFTSFKNGRGVLESDQKLWTDASKSTYVQRYSGRVGGLQGLRFNVEFVGKPNSNYDGSKTQDNKLI
ncbi:cationic peroxidase 2 [Cinnamomum micranthum f. kanehirae]|uniref:Cationic peroxidase 2 n=1 Tax=Cinnamomum micranthum f. kanehirae TaxID=337451 RepID=A0A3S4PFW5_9MAGN|nr:cationic peroxidase 2 [Cinnamomum micranthum f. kanehirae]